LLNFLRKKKWISFVQLTSLLHFHAKHGCPNEDWFPVNNSISERHTSRVPASFWQPFFLRSGTRRASIILRVHSWSGYQRPRNSFYLPFRFNRLQKKISKKWNLLGMPTDKLTGLFTLFFTCKWHVVYHIFNFSKGFYWQSRVALLLTPRYGSMTCTVFHSAPGQCVPLL